jgi:hypothetical protein
MHKDSWELVLLPPESLPLKVATSLDTHGEAAGQTNNRRDKLSRAEDIVLAAIRSHADIDGKNARVAYECLAAMTKYSTRHVKRVVKTLIYERGLLRVNKRKLKPGRNAINVYHVMERDNTATDKGIGRKTGKTGQSETTWVTEPVTQIAKPRTIPTLRHAPLNSASVTEKPASPYLAAGSKPRYFTQLLTPPEKAA